MVPDKGNRGFDQFYPRIRVAVGIRIQVELVLSGKHFKKGSFDLKLGDHSFKNIFLLL